MSIRLGRMVMIFFLNGDFFGRSVTVDGDVIIVGADDGGDNGEGSTYIFRRNQTSWTLETRLTAPNRSEGFGFDVSIMGNFSMISDVAFGDFQDGGVFMYEYESLSYSWSLFATFPMLVKCSYYFGSFVRLTYDESLLIGCDGDNSTLYYKKHKLSGASEYILEQEIKFGNFLISVDVDGNTMIASERRESISSLIHFYVWKDHVWKQVKKLMIPALNCHLDTVLLYLEM
ncbi:hypothetical protein ACHAWX_000148 [Stephanocyclus meneghinianus]